MTKTTPERDRLIAALSDADNEYRRVRTNVEQEIRREMAKRIDAVLIKRDMLAYEARQAGASMPRIAFEGLHTKASVTAYKAIEHGRRYIEPDTEDSADSIERVEFQFGAAGVLHVVPLAADLKPILEALGIPEEQGQGRSATFRYDAAEERLEAITSAWDDEEGRHPVVALVTGENASYRNRVLAWARDNYPAAA